MDSDDDFFVLNRPLEVLEDEGNTRQRLSKTSKVTKKKKTKKKGKKRQKSEHDIDEKVVNLFLKSPEGGANDDVEESIVYSRSGSPSHTPSAAILDIMQEIQDVEREASESKAEVVKEEYQPKNRKRNKSDMEDSEDSQEDFEIRQIEHQIRLAKSAIKKSSASQSSDADARQLLESRRVYQFKIISKLPGSANYETLVEVTGSKKFRKVISATLKRIASNIFIPHEYRNAYTVDGVVLVWKSKIRIYEYMKPSFLNLPPPTVSGGKTFVTVHIMTKAAAERENDVGEIVVDDDVEEIQELSDYEVDFDDEGNDAKASIVVSSTEPPEGVEYFTIRLKDKEGNKFEIQVNENTQLQKIVNYYLTKKNLTRRSNIKLIFDDEPLDVRQKVGDTELEDEFEIDVVVE